MEPGIRPIVPVISGCPKCGQPLVLIVKSIDIIMLSDNGTPINLIANDHNTTGMCPHCGDSFDMVSNNDSKYHPVFNQDVYDMSKYAIDAKLIKTSKRLYLPAKTNGEELDTSINPFSKIEIGTY